MLIHEHLTQWLAPQWGAPSSVQALVSTTAGSMSRGAYKGFNTADHVGANPAEVSLCRQYFQQRFAIKHAPQWLNQVHGIDVVAANSAVGVTTADACYTDQSEIVCTLHTADCLPVFFCDRKGEEVALAHAGWRGLADGILENTIARFRCAPSNILCWLGPAISQPHFEVGDEVKAVFQRSQTIPKNAFVPSGRVSEAGSHYFCDLFALATKRLRSAGVVDISGGDYCTFSDPRFFSYRRQKITGRILSALWIASSH